MSYPITNNYINKNRSRQSLNPQGMVVHDTATPGATDENEQSYFNNNSVSASAHTFIDWDSITETVPCDSGNCEVAWGSGYTSNHKFLQVELCVPAAHDPAKFNEVWNRAVWYFAYKFINVVKIQTITRDNLMGHNEVSNKWHETNHQDPVAYFREYGKNVDDFRTAVQAEINRQTGGSSGGSPTPTPKGNSDVLYLQRTLNRLKITDENGNALAEDGIIGNHTIQSTRMFQALESIAVDGIAGPQTWIALNSILIKPTCSINQKPYSSVIRYIQWRVGTTADGLWGPLTDKAVRQYQANNGLASDGIIGPMTWNKLIG